MTVAPHIPKSSRYTIGSRIENKFLDLLELAYRAYFIEKDRKLEYITKCIITLDTLKFLLHVSWEGKLVSHAHYGTLGEKLDEIGKMLGGWKKGIEQKTPTQK